MPPCRSNTATLLRKTHTTFWSHESMLLPSQQKPYIYCCLGWFANANIQKQFYQTALGNCSGLKLPKCWLQLQKKNHCVTYYNFWHTFVPVQLHTQQVLTSCRQWWQVQWKETDTRLSAVTGQNMITALKSPNCNIWKKISTSLSTWDYI